jgi:hypothetical protein
LLLGQPAWGHSSVGRALEWHSYFSSFPPFSAILHSDHKPLVALDIFVPTFHTVRHRNPRECGANPVPTVKLSDLTVLKLKGSTSHADYFDLTLPGFGVRVSPKGTKTFILKLRSGRQALGRYPILSLSEARTEAKRLLAERTLGRTDPARSPTPKPSSSSSTTKSATAARVQPASTRGSSIASPFHSSATSRLRTWNARSRKSHPKAPMTTRSLQHAFSSTGR